jgi:3-isopropylmalate dehydratase small subunit
MEKFTGRVWLLGDDIDTDIIMPTEYLAFKTIDEMKPYAFSPLRPELAGKISPGDIIVAGSNFGCGSSREQAPIALKQAQVALVVAQGFARIFRRNCINIGMPVFVADAVGKLKTGEIIEVDLEKGTINAPCGVIQSAPLSENVLKTLEYGGLIPRVRAELGIKE